MTTIQKFTTKLAQDVPGLDKGTRHGFWSIYCGVGRPECTEMECNGVKVSYNKGGFTLISGGKVEEEIFCKPFEVMVAEKYTRKYKNAEKRGLEFSLTLADMKRLLKRKTCFYTGIKLTKPTSYDLIYSDFTLDRKDPKVGYTKENTVVCCHGANNLKAMLERGDVNGLELKHKIKLMKKTLEVI